MSQRYQPGQRVLCTDASFLHVPPDERVGIVTRDDGDPEVWVAWFCLQDGNTHGYAMPCKRTALRPAP